MISILMTTMRRLQAAVATINLLHETTVGHEIEVICVVDADKETANAVNAMKFSRKDFQVIVLYNPVIRTSSVGINQGLAIAKGEYITFSSDDSGWHQGWLDTTLKAHAEKQITAQAEQRRQNRRRFLSNA